MSSNNNEPSSAEKRAERITRYKEERRKQLQQRQYANLSTTAASAAAGECSSSSNEEHIEEESYAKYKYVPNFFYSGGIKLPEFLIFFFYVLKATQAAAEGESAGGFLQGGPIRCQGITCVGGRCGCRHRFQLQRRERQESK